MILTGVTRYIVMVRLPASAGRIPGLIAPGSGAAPEKVRE